METVNLLLKFESGMDEHLMEGAGAGDAVAYEIWHLPEENRHATTCTFGCQRWANATCRWVSWICGFGWAQWQGGFIISCRRTHECMRGRVDVSLARVSHLGASLSFFWPFSWFLFSVLWCCSCLSFWFPPVERSVGAELYRFFLPSIRFEPDWQTTLSATSAPLKKGWMKRRKATYANSMKKRKTIAYVWS